MVVAAIVTYNPDIERLLQNIKAVKDQVEAVLVFDNASNNYCDIEALLVGDAYALIPGTENVGLAKALNALCKRATELGATHALLLDQDSVVGEGMVSALQSHIKDDVGLVSPQIVDRNMREGFVLAKCDVPLKRAITSGALISLDAWRAVGGFDERLFVDWVDYEFCANLRSHNYRLIRVNCVMLLHEMGHREYAFSLPTPGGMRSFYRVNHAISRHRDKARSWAIVKRKYGWSWIGCEERLYIASIALRDILIERNRFLIIKAFYEGEKEGRKVYADSSEVGEIA